MNQTKICHRRNGGKYSLLWEDLCVYTTSFRKKIPSLLNYSCFIRKFFIRMHIHRPVKRHNTDTAAYMVRVRCGSRQISSILYVIHNIVICHVIHYS